MAYKAPTPAGQGHQGDWYVPVIGMGAGSVIGDGMQALKTQWADTLRLLSGKASLPTTENIASLSGGITAGGKGAQVTRDVMQPVSALEKLSPEEAMSYFGRAQKAADEGYTTAHAIRGDFGRVVGNDPQNMLLRPSVENMGGMVPEREVLDRVMNSGMRDKILGMGAVGGTMPSVTLPPPGVERGGRNDIISKLLGVSYPGYKIMRVNTGNNSQNEQLRQLGFGN